MKRSEIVISTLILTAVAAFAVCDGVIAAKASGNTAKGKTYYAKAKCDLCHGKVGTGVGPASKSLKPQLKSFSDAKYMTKRTDKQLFNAIKNGAPAGAKSPKMPAFKKKLSDSKINAIVAYMRSLSKNEKKGKELYVKTKCAACHGKLGKGDGPAGKALKPPPKSFANSKYMSKRTDKQLFDAIKNGAPAGAKSKMMMSFKKKLKDSQIGAIVAYVRSMSRKSTKSK